MKPKVELNVETQRSSIGYELKNIVKEMLECGQTRLSETSTFAIALKIGDEVFTDNVETHTSVDIEASDTLLEKIRSSLKEV